jgi:hypothetical protein
MSYKDEVRGNFRKSVSCGKCAEDNIVLRFKRIPADQGKMHKSLFEDGEKIGVDEVERQLPDDPIIIDKPWGREEYFIAEVFSGADEDEVEVKAIWSLKIAITKAIDDDGFDPFDVPFTIEKQGNAKKTRITLHAYDPGDE